MDMMSLYILWVVPPWNIIAGKHTFHYRSASLWNRLPVEVQSKFTDMSLNEFKSFINVFFKLICMIFFSVFVKLMPVKCKYIVYNVESCMFI